MKAWQFVPAIRKDLLERELAIESSRPLIIDLESSINYPHDKVKEELSKQLARDNIREILKCPTKRSRIGIRPNDIRSVYAEEDIGLINDEASFFYFAVVPTIRSADDLSCFRQKISHNVRLIPLIETVSAVENLDDILDRLGEERTAIFGDHDYFLDAQAFPIPSSPLESDEYRRVLTYLNKKCRDKGVELVDGAYVKVHDFDGLRKICEYLFSIGISSKLALTPRQAEVIEEMPDVDNYAQEIINRFESKSDDPRSFRRFDDGYVITPHEYLAARKFKEYKEGIRANKGK